MNEPIDSILNSVQTGAGLGNILASSTLQPSSYKVESKLSQRTTNSKKRRKSRRKKKQIGGQKVKRKFSTKKKNRRKRVKNPKKERLSKLRKLYATRSATF